MSNEQRQKLFNFLLNELGVTALEGHLYDIEDIINPKVFPYVESDEEAPRKLTDQPNSISNESIEEDELVIDINDIENLLISYHDLKKIPVEKKEEIIKSIVDPCTKMLLYVFLSLGLDNFIEQMVINQTDNKEYILTFQTKECFQKRFKPKEVVLNTDKDIPPLSDKQLENIACELSRTTINETVSEDELAEKFMQLENWIDFNHINLEDQEGQCYVVVELDKLKSKIKILTQ